MNWISVKDGLPEKPGRFLIYSDLGNDSSRIWVTQFLDKAQGFLFAYHVTHWMPLPEPPKEDK